MILKDFIPQAGAVDMDIYLGSGDALVTQHLLDGAQVSPSLEQVGRKTMAQGVRADHFSDSGELAQLLYNVKNHLAREHCPPAVEEQDVFTAALDHLMRACLLQVKIDLVDGNGRDGHNALFVALALNHDIALIDKKL